MSESPSEKRTRVLGAGPRRKRDTREMDSQMRAYGRATRRVRLSPEVAAIRDKIAEIKKLEEAVRLVDYLKADRNRPYHEAVQRVNRAEIEVAEAKSNLERVKLAGMQDVSDLDERQEKLRAAIGRLGSEVETMYKKVVDSSSVESA